MALINAKNQVDILLNSISATTEKSQQDNIERLKRVQKRVEEMTVETHEEIKSDEQ